MTNSAEFWESRYADRDQVWSGNPNHALVSTISGRPPGEALDLGCGEGGDSVWLAEQGWRVTAVDVSATAVARGRELASRRNVPEGRITWLVEDLSSWEPGTGFDLVSACFLHSPIAFPRKDVLRRCAAAVAPGGHLLVVGHAGPMPWTSPRATPQHDSEHRFLGPIEQIAELDLDTAEWEIEVSELQPRRATGPDGQSVDIDDAIVLARRR